MTIALRAFETGLIGLTGFAVAFTGGWAYVQYHLGTPERTVIKGVTQMSHLTACLFIITGLGFILVALRFIILERRHQQTGGGTIE